MSGIMISWFVELGLITMNSLTHPIEEGGAKFANSANQGGKHLPLPADLIASAIVWGGLGILGQWQKATTLAVLIGVGLNVATFLSPYISTNAAIGQPAASFQKLFPGGLTLSTTKTPTQT